MSNQTAQHTPGPWTFKKAYYVGTEPDEHYVMGTCDFGEVRLADVMCEADARLIAEAPALLDDLRLLVSRIMDDAGGADLLPVEEEWDPENYAAIMRARATIARAEGRGA